MKRYFVGDVLRLQRRAVMVEAVATYREIGVRSFGKGIFHKEPVLGAELGNKRVFRIEPGDLVFSNVFAWEGAVGLATTAEEGMIGSHRFMTYSADSDIAHAHYLKYLFTSDYGRTLLLRASPGSAGRNRTLAIDRFANVEIQLPNIEDQHRVAAKLDRLLALTSQVRTSSSATRAEILVNLYPAAAEVVLRKYSSGVTRVGDVADVVSDVVHPGQDPGEAQVFVGLQHIEPHLGRRRGESPLGGETGRKFRFAPGDVLYGYLRPYLNKAWVADRHGLCSVDQYVLRPRKVPARLLGHVLRSRSVWQQAVDLTHSLQLPRLRSGLLLDLEIPRIESRIAPRACTELDALVDRVVNLVDDRRRSDALVSALESSALNRAIAGVA